MLSVFDNGVSGVIRQQLGYLRTLGDTTQLMLFWSTVRPNFGHETYVHKEAWQGMSNLAWRTNITPSIHPASNQAINQSI